MPTTIPTAPSSPATSTPRWPWRTSARDARGADEIAVIGGTAVFEAALPVATRIYKTEVHGSPAGRRATSLPSTGPSGIEVSREALPRGPNDDFTATLVVFDRR